MLTPSQCREVGWVVVERVPVPMVDDHACRQRPVGCLPRHDRTRPPHVRFGHLDPRTVLASAGPDASGAHGNAVRRPRAWAKLRRQRPSFTLSGRAQVPGALGGALVGAVVDLTPLGWLAVEHGATHRARQAGKGGRAPRQCAPVTFPARLRAVDEPARVAPQPVGLHLHRCAATATRCVDHARQYSGSGTTLAVATGHGRDAIGIDLDARNASLARERVGMWLTEVTATELAAALGGTTEAAA